MSNRERAAEATRDPIWVVQERRIIIFPNGNWDWCSDCECFHKASYAWTPPEEAHMRYTAASILEEDSDACTETWEVNRGYLFLSRVEAEDWAARNRHNLSSEGWRVYCMALPRESSLTLLLREHVPTQETTDAE